MLQLHALHDLVMRYISVFRLVWARRAELEGTPRQTYEAEFLPAALALQETPLSPAPRVAIGLLILFAAITVLWACLGRIDIVATAQGKIVPNGRVKTIQPMETAVVSSIHVTDGQAVKAGDLLISLDATVAEADLATVDNNLQASQLMAARDRALLNNFDGLRQGKPVKPVLIAPEGIDKAQIENEQRNLDGEWHELSSKLARLEADKTSRQAELRAIQATVVKLNNTAPIARRLADDYRKLSGQQFVANHDYLQREQTRLDMEGELAAQQQKLLSTKASLQEAELQRIELLATTQKNALDRLHDSEQKIADYRQSQVKARQQRQLSQLVAPVDGIVQQLEVHTVGGVVTPAQPLLVLVPADQALEIEAFLENKDIGFVNPGQAAEIKIETFPYTRYGTLHGEVTQVSSDAINDEKRGLIYSARIRLPRTTMTVGNKQVNLTPGMAVTVEIKTGARRVAEYFLSPLIEHTKESLHER